ncbi:MAG: 3-oxoacyl-[Deltaproteobacteria bacterium]|jgi:3-oxoacyl-[acyl-carrier protein] reductase|nr:3-oxoacyl-[acyl-carrier-protein] reductase [Deltaproteobacteria bacterium]MBQ6668642.1 3-oxoacyl-[acyl-carrier-protein] reductase [Deltaproteobacteria bacterium]
MPKGKIALVTGAGQGIGASIAIEMGKLGAAVAVVDIDLENAERTAASIRAAGGQAQAFATNVAEADQVKSLFASVTEQFGGLDILVNNAGITRDGLLIRMRDEDWDDVLNVNLKGAFLCIREAARIMSKRKYGRIVNISSVVAQMGNAGQANYCASKAGLIGLTRSCARELARRQITVNAVAPGFIETAMTRDLPEKVRDGLLAMIPLERLGQPEDVMRSVVFLAGEGAGYITGQVLEVNGGMHM